MSKEPHPLIADVAQVLRRKPDAARREAKEETGVLINAEQQEFCSLIHHDDPGSRLDRIRSSVLGW